MPGRKRRGAGGAPRSKRKREDDLELASMDSGDINTGALDAVSGDDEEIMFNALNREEEEDAIDPKYPHRVEGKDIDAFLGDVDKEEEALALDEQRKRASHLTEEDFGLPELLPKAKGKKAGQKRGRQPAGRDYSRDLDALGAFLSQRGDTEGAAEQVEKDYASLPSDVRRKMLERDSPEILPMLKEFEEKLTHARTVLLPLIERVQKGELPSSEAVSFLELKLQLFLSYLMHVTFYLLLKAEGKPIQNNPVVGRLVELRVYMDRLKPIEKRMHHQITRLISRAGSGGAGPADAAAEGGGRANISELIAAAPSAAADGLYKASKVSGGAVDPEAKKKRQQKLLELQKQRIEQAQEGAMVRAQTTRKEEKLLKRAQRAGLSRVDDSVGEAAGVDKGIKGTLLDSGGVGIMQRIRQQQAAADESDAEGEEEAEEGEESEDNEGGGEAEDDEEAAEAQKLYREEVQRREAEKRARKKELRRASQQQGGASRRDALSKNQAADVVEGHRLLSKEIVQNKGLTPKRPRKHKNPRIRAKHMHHKKEIKRRSQVKSVAQPKDVYGGERHIRTDVVRSHKIRT